MRLINAHTLKLESHHMSRSNTPPYAILSHTWDSNEVTLPDIQKLSSKELQAHPGFKKIRYTCQQAVKDGYTHAWIDSCCIDKSSSAELSEAINSMFEWYSRADVCYAYLSDVNSTNETSLNDQFAGSRWFTRGWTLQELLAPKTVWFYDFRWKYLGTSDYLVEVITYVTGIAKPFLFPKARPRLRLETASIAQRMSWAAKRQTTRVEDEAYSLLGLFRVNMPLMYGEGRRAFIRLQEEIMKTTTDHSIFVWNRTGGMLLADSPRGFHGNWNVIYTPGVAMNQPFSLTNAGLKIRLPVGYHEESGQYQCLLNCQYNDGDREEKVGLRIQPVQKDSINYDWTWLFQKPLRLDKAVESKWTTAALARGNNEEFREMTVLHPRWPQYPQIIEKELDYLLTPRYFIDTEFTIAEIHPYQCWSEEKRCLSRSRPRDGILGVLILKSGASCFGVVLMDRLPPTVFITGAAEPVELSQLILAAHARRTTLRTRGVWQDMNGREIIYSSERHHYVATWISKIRIGYTSPNMVLRNNLQSNVLIPALSKNPFSFSHPTNRYDSDRLVIAIDYGTHHTGFAHAFPTMRSCFRLDEINVFQEWGKEVSLDEKTPSKIAYHNNEIQWGKFLSEDAVAITHIKLDLETHGSIPREFPGQINQSHVWKSPVEIVTDFFTKLSEYLSVKLGIFGNVLQEQRDTDVVIIVPGNWSHDALECLFRAVVSGFQLEERLLRLRNILAVSETEAAAIYAVRNLIEKGDDYLEAGNTFVLCDANDDGVDAATYKIKSLHPTELGQADVMLARKLFSVHIDDRFLLWLKRLLGEQFKRLDPEGIVGSENMTESKDYATSAMRQVLREFNQLKESFNHGAEHGQLKVPALSDYRTIQGFLHAGLLTIPYEVMTSFFDPIIQDILEVIQSQVFQLEDGGSGPKCIIFIGSLAESDYLCQEVEVASKKLLQIPVSILPKGWTAALRGAVLYAVEKEGLGQALRRLVPLPTTEN